MKYIDDMTKDELVDFYKNANPSLRELLCVYKNLDKYFDKNAKLYYLRQHFINVEKMIEDKAYKLSLNELEKSKNKHPILERIYDFKVKINLKDFSRMTKDELIYYYQNIEYNFEDLLKIYVEMKYHDFKDSDYKVVKDKLYSYSFDLSKNELISYRTEENSFIVDELLESKKRINKKDIENMTKAELEFVYDNNPTVEDLYRIMNVMPKFNYEERAYENVKNSIKNLVDDLEYNDVVDIYNRLKDKYDVSIIENYIQRNLRIMNKNIESLDYDEIEDLVYDYDLTPSELLRCRHRLFNIDMSDEKRDRILESIEFHLEGVLDDMDDIYDLKREVMIAEKYNVSPLMINRRINQLNKELSSNNANYENQKKSCNFFTKKSFNNIKDNEDLDLSPWEQELKDSGEYEDYHFEEENLEEDDYGYEDF